MLTSIRRVPVVPLPQVRRMALKFIYEIQRCTRDEVTALTMALKVWDEKLRLDTELNRVLPAEQEDFKHIVDLLQMNERGELEQRKKTFRFHGIDYRKYHRLPEAYTAADFARGQQLAEEAQRRDAKAGI